MQSNAQSEEMRKKMKLHSISGHIGHHSIGWPFAFRFPYHVNVQIDANWQRNSSKPNRLMTTSLGYTNRPGWSSDAYLVFSYNPKFNFISDKLYFSWKIGAGAMMSYHRNLIYEFENNQFNAKKLNAKITSLMVFGLESGHQLNEKTDVGVVWHWLLQTPYGSGLPFLPNSNYTFKLTYKLKK